MLATALQLDVVEGSLAGVRLFGSDIGGPDGDPEAGRDALTTVVIGVQAFVGGFAYFIGTILGLFATGSSVASLLERGQVDLLLSKPLPRWKILLGRLGGVWAVMLGLAVYLLGAVWLVMSLKSGVWNPSLLLAIGVVFLMFSVLYAAVTLVSVWTGSTALSLIVAYALIFVSIVLAFYEQLLPQVAPWFRPVLTALYHALPNFAEVSQTVAQLAGIEPVATWYPLISSTLFGLVVYGAAFWIFRRKDF